MKEVGDQAWEEFKQVFEERLREREEGNGKDLVKEQNKKKKK